MARLMGQMMQMPLMISSLLVHAARPTATPRSSPSASRATSTAIPGTRDRAARAQARPGAGWAAAGRPASPRWPGTATAIWRYYGASGGGSWCATINPRLFPDQIAWIANHAADQVLCFDLTFLPLVERLVPALTSVKHLGGDGGPRHMPADHDPEPAVLRELVDAEDGVYRWPEFDENTASSICYTLGHHRQPKGRASTATARRCCTPTARLRCPTAWA